MVEDPWPNTTQKAHVSFSVHNGHYTITIGHCLIQLGIWGAVSPPAASGQNPGGGAGGEAPGSSENIVFYSTGKRA